jgi:predicted neutral ceramidase superfamily lipid hydrolase
MGWSTVFIILGILAGILGLWNLARQRNVFLACTSILWFLIVLFAHYIRSWYDFVLISGLPSVGNLMLWVLLPAFLILAFFSGGRR